LHVYDIGVNKSRRHFPVQLLVGLGSISIVSVAWARASTDVLLARNAPPGIDPAGYLVSEKLDGVRALWDGSGLRFRSGRPVPAPAWFLARLPDTALDGELWLGRGRFDALSATVRRTQPVDAEWQQVQYRVFELPLADGTFEDRAERLKGVVATTAWTQLQAVEQFSVANNAVLQARLKTITAAGGEGLVLHLASASVTVGRSDVLLKLKTLQDAEAVVLGHVPGKGKYRGSLGALSVRAENGQTFKLGTGFSDLQRRHPPAIGSTVIYSYQELTPGGKPRFARFLRVYSED
ncbi:MAG: DNA ligase, partial [Betaproteobacteria bacterium]